MCIVHGCMISGGGFHDGWVIMGVWVACIIGGWECKMHDGHDRWVGYIMGRGNYDGHDGWVSMLRRSA